MVCKKNLSEWYHKVLDEADITDSRYPVKGMLIYKKWGLFVIREMQRYLEKMLEESDHEPTLFPVLIPEDTLGKETEHIAGFEEEVFWITHAGANKLERRLALRPTSETPIYEMFRLWIRSHNDLPLKIHQSCAVYRYETKHTRPLIRGREFLWNEGHSAHVDAKDAKENVEDIKRIYERLIKDLLCLPFVINRRPEWDRFPGADETYAFDTLMPDGKTLQIATVHNLGQNFSKVFDITYEDIEGKHLHVFQTSYGPSFGRLLAAAISIHGDDKGLVLPPEIAPLQIVIIPIVFKKSGSEEVIAYAKKIKEELDSLGIRVKIDEGEDRPGSKFYRWEMKGVPLRMDVGPRDLKEGKITVVRRDTGEKSQIGFDEIEGIKTIFKDISDNLREKAESRFRSRIFKIENIDDIKGKVGKGIIIAGLCSGGVCSERIEEHADILCVNETVAKCIVCGGEGREIKIAKTY